MGSNTNKYQINSRLIHKLIRKERLRRLQLQLQHLQQVNLRLEQIARNIDQHVE